MKNFKGRPIVASFSFDKESGFMDFGERIGALSVIDDKLIVVTDEGAYQLSKDDFKPEDKTP
jgi:hypothetical protein